MKKQTYPPVVSVLGHVDHGKTTLLDAIRKTNIAEKEHGGITQKIGASKIETTHEGQKRSITFIDTPGHETFSKMRGRGAKVADIGILVVAATEGIKPQTVESIKAFKDAKIPFIVVLTKIDLQTSNPQKVKQELLKEEVLLEGYGGDVPVIEVSAKANKNIKELLDLILLVNDLNLEKDGNLASQNFEAVTIESKLDKRQGPLATMVVKKGQINLREKIVAEDSEGVVKALIDDKGKNVKEALIGDAVEVLGFEKVPKVGAKVFKKDEAKKELKIAEQEIKVQSKPLEYAFEQKNHALNLILRADTQGSLEAITQALSKDVNIVSQKTGEITESDIMHAKSIAGIVIGFNTKIRNEAIKIAKEEKVLLKNYTIIYELIDEIHDVLEGKKLALEERVFGEAKVLASFPFEKTKVLGIAILEGRIARGDKVRLLRGEDVIGESSISSVRQGKNQVSKVEKGQEAGVIISPFLDFTIGDMLISHE